jgi:hypothetical protein
MDPQDPKNVGRDTAQDLSGLVGKFAAPKAVAHHWLTDPEYAAFTHRLEAAHAAAEAALVVQRSTCQRSLIGCRDCETREEVLARRIATAFSWAHASRDNAEPILSRHSRAGEQGRDRCCPLISTNAGEILEQVSAGAGTAPIDGYALPRTTLLTNLFRPKLTSSAASSASMLGSGSRATLLTLAHGPSSTDKRSPAPVFLIC